MQPNNFGMIRVFIYDSNHIHLNYDTLRKAMDEFIINENELDNTAHLIYASFEKSEIFGRMNLFWLVMKIAEVTENVHIYIDIELLFRNILNKVTCYQMLQKVFELLILTASVFTDDIMTDMNKHALKFLLLAVLQKRKKIIKYSEDCCDNHVDETFPKTLAVDYLVSIFSQKLSIMEAYERIDEFKSEFVIPDMWIRESLKLEYYQQNEMNMNYSSTDEEESLSSESDSVSQELFVNTIYD